MSFFGKLFGQTDIIYIHTDKQQYYGGEIVSGQVILSVTKPLHVDGIYLKLCGKEFTEFDVERSKEVNDGNGGTKTIYYTQTLSQENTFFRRKYCIFSTKSTLQGGNFVFPFQFQLQTNLPGTFDITNQKRFAKDLKASINYQVGVEVAVPGMLQPNLRHSQDILICEPLRGLIMCSDTLKEAKVTFLCCIPKGTVTLSANIDKNAYGPGETAQLHLIVDNSLSQVDLEAFSLKLVRKLEVRAKVDNYAGQSWGAGSQSVSVKSWGGEETYTDQVTVVKVSSPGVKAGERAERYIQLTLPHDTEPSTKSMLIDCSYELSVVLKVPWSPDVVTKQAVQIFAPPRQTYIAHLQYPTDWAPSVMPMCDLEKMQYVSY